MATLTNTKIKDTYKSLIKTNDNEQITGEIELTDGVGTLTGVKISNDGSLKADGELSFGSLKDTGEDISIQKFVDESDGIENNDNDTSIPTSAAVKNYVDTTITAEDLDFTGNTGQGDVDLDSETFDITGSNGITTTAEDNSLEIDGSALQTAINTNSSDITTNAGNIVTNQTNISTNATNIASNDVDIANNTDNISTNATAIAGNTSNITANSNNIATNTSDISTNSGNITTNTGNIATNTTDIASNDADISAIDTRVTTNEGAITSNTGNIATNTSNISENQGDIETNSTNITNLTSSVSTNTSNISSNATAINTNTGNISTNTGSIGTNATNISNNASAISTNSTDISTNATNIATNATNISSNDTDISALQTNVGTNAGNISTNTSNISSNTTNIATNTSNVATNAADISTNEISINNNTGNISTNASGISSNATAITGKVSKAGDTMTNNLFINSGNTGQLTVNNRAKFGTHYTQTDVWIYSNNGDNILLGGGIASAQNNVRVENGSIYTSQGLYVGGTGTANLLDDYEEGTYNFAMQTATTVYSGNTTNFGSQYNNESTYTKIGSVVHVFLRVKFNAHPSAWSSTSSSIFLTNLPFLPVSGTLGGNFGFSWNAELTSTEEGRFYGNSGHLGQPYTVTNGWVYLSPQGRYNSGYYSYWGYNSSLRADDFPGNDPGGSNYLTGQFTYTTNS